MAEKKKPAADPKDEEEKDPTESEDDTEDGDDPSKKDDTAGEGEEEESEDDSEEEEDTDKPPIPLRSSASHIIARKDRKIKKLKSELDKKDEEAEDEGDEADSEEDDDLTPEARRAVDRHISRKMAPIVNTIISNTDEGEIKDLFAREPGAKAYEKRIRAYMAHPAYKGVAAEVIFHHLAFRSAAATGAKKKNAADLQARGQRGAGSGHRPTDIKDKDLPSQEDLEGMSDEEIEDLETDIKKGKFAPKG